jgi:AcrR family transcriptional regulator
MEGVRFSAYLRALSLQITKARSGEKTKLRLLAEGAALLDSTGFRELNVEDVSKSAGMAKGTFYIHFQSKDEFLIELGRRYVEFELATMPLSEQRSDAFERFQLWVTWYEKTFALNVGVLRCVVQMGDVNPAMRAVWYGRNRRMSDAVQSRWFNPEDVGVIDPLLAQLTLRTAGTMLDESLFERYKVQVGLGREEPDDIALLNELHALLIYRAIYGENPPAAALKRTKALLNWPAKQ